MAAIRDAPQHIAVGIDGSLGSRAAVRWAIDHARQGDTVTLIHAWQTSPSRAEPGFARDDETVARRFAARELAHADALARNGGVGLECKVLQGDPRDCLREVETDVLVIGARGQGGIAGLLRGSVCTYLAHHAHRPLVIVPLSAGDQER